MIARREKVFGVWVYEKCDFQISFCKFEFLYLFGATSLIWQIFRVRTLFFEQPARTVGLFAAEHSKNSNICIAVWRIHMYSCKFGCFVVARLFCA
jgi:hypothetical protein